MGSRSFKKKHMGMTVSLATKLANRMCNCFLATVEPVCGLPENRPLGNWGSWLAQTILIVPLNQGILYTHIVNL